MKKAVFLDRDGVLIEDAGYIGATDAVKFFPFTFEILRLLQKEFLLFIVTNQSGVSQGITTAEEVAAVNRYILQSLSAEGVTVSKLYCCPHTDADNCDCRKPAPRFAHEAAAEFTVDLSASYMIGDHPSDIRFAENFGGTGLYVLTGHGEKHRNEVSTDLIFSSLKEAGEFILK